MKPFTRLCILLLSLIALLQLVRFLAGWPVLVADVAVPVWSSAVFAVIAGGRRVLAAKASASAISGAYAAIAGGLYATYISFIDPVSFDIHVSVLVVTMVVVGGARTLAGPVVGAFLLIAIPQMLAMIDLPSTLVGPVRQLIYGAILIAFMLWRPQGIAGRSL